MTRRMNNKSKLVKAVSVALSIYMALSPMVVYADELADAENNVSVQNEVKEEAAKCVEEAVDNAETPKAQADFEDMVADVDVSDVESRNTLEDTSALVQDEINRIESYDAKNSVVQEYIAFVEEFLKHEKKVGGKK